ncbi:MAG: acetate/propionate family kinase [Thermoplasmata archaeon]
MTDAHEPVTARSGPIAEGRSPVVATINIGSSSVKFALFERARRTRDVARLASGTIDRVGESRSTFSVDGGAGSRINRTRVRVGGYGAAIREVMEWIDSGPYRTRLGAVGHRVVHGGRRFVGPQRVTPAMLRTLRSLVPLDPDHLPAEIEGIQIIRRRYPRLLQVACFDTAFHRDMPEAAKLYGIPRRWSEEGVIRYGFHGLSCEFIVGALAAGSGTRRPPGRLVVAHLGNGCSLTAIRDGKSVDTTMGFTPTGGVVMSTRAGDLDPEVVVYLARRLRRSPSRLTGLLNRESGLLGISGTTGDMRELLRRAPKDRRAQSAVDLFCYQAQKSLGALTAVLGGLDTLVFTGGIGEHSPEIRRRICQAVRQFGVRVDRRRNARDGPVISTPRSRSTVRVIPSDEERMIATHTFRVFAAERERSRR